MRSFSGAPKRQRSGGQPGPAGARPKGNILVHYDAALGRYSAWLLDSFEGSVGEGVAVAEDTSGRAQLYVVCARRYWGAENVVLVYDRNGHLMPGSDGIFADPQSKPVVLRSPSSST
ncbi:MAG: hypothetical protein RMJ53_10845, partial [Chitinophagales bacterium]|nr:hypothetical protein [Chitinophagales bacterium]